MVPFDERFGTNGLTGMDIVLHDGPQHFEFARFAHAPPPIDGHAVGTARSVRFASTMWCRGGPRLDRG
ncbi:hypothetical protein NicSoilB8_24400 [Arthrobacter sp. NicSoilB8]|nr:hypothetical protein NicSoilB8_24400 [Arthrobacter sp. NicSoilB8]